MGQTRKEVFSEAHLNTLYVLKIAKKTGERGVGQIKISKWAKSSCQNHGMPGPTKARPPTNCCTSTASTRRGNPRLRGPPRASGSARAAARRSLYCAARRAGMDRAMTISTGPVDPGVLSTLQTLVDGNTGCFGSALDDGSRPFVGVSAVKEVIFQFHFRDLIWREVCRRSRQEYARHGCSTPGCARSFRQAEGL